VDNLIEADALESGSKSREKLGKQEGGAQRSKRRKKRGRNEVNDTILCLNRVTTLRGIEVEL
jgi:hypothetical protein